MTIEFEHQNFCDTIVLYRCDGIPANPRSWLISAGQVKAMDTIHRRTRFDSFLPEIAPENDTNDPNLQDAEDVEDDSPEGRLLRLALACGRHGQTLRYRQRSNP